MNILWYFLTAVFSLVGILAVARTIERLLAGAGLLRVQLIVALIALILAVACLKKARTAA